MMKNTKDRPTITPELERVWRLEAENKRLKERIAELEQHINNFHESLKEAMKPENWQQ